MTNESDYPFRHGLRSNVPLSISAVNCFVAGLRAVDAVVMTTNCLGFSALRYGTPLPNQDLLLSGQLGETTLRCLKLKPNINFTVERDADEIAFY